MFHNSFNNIITPACIIICRNQRLVSVAPVRGIVGAQLCDEIDRLPRAILQQWTHSRCRLVGKIEVHVSGLTVWIWAKQVIDT